MTTLKIVLDTLSVQVGPELKTVNNFGAFAEFSVCEDGLEVSVNDGQKRFGANVFVNDEEDIRDLIAFLQHRLDRLEAKKGEI